ncbi:DUF3039 domain-containing protein [Kocuria sediminis]|uniref:DUF3039 domain-containing protein n=1 Tax=Kocuria sediminis TaxID=1038857 RepID=A0A6N8GKU0_9MICC|nr:DUF3039 domain-containing protein [Kocuria sediminis]MUN61585.1 DUF3039 domain-containing protein [Kocuria sediminis]
MSTITAPAPETAATTKTAKPPTIIHLMHQDDILEAQVYGVPGVAVCGFEFVPSSGSATSGGGESVVCESCDILTKCGVRHPRKRR